MNKRSVCKSVGPIAKRLRQAPGMKRLMVRTLWFRFLPPESLVCAPAPAGFEASVAQMVVAPPVRPEVVGSIPDCCTFFRSGQCVRFRSTIWRISLTRKDSETQQRQQQRAPAANFERRPVIREPAQKHARTKQTRRHQQSAAAQQQQLGLVSPANP